MNFLKASHNKYRYSLFILLLLSIILSFRIFTNSIVDLNLHFDEAQYWGWSKDLDLGYFSKPPLLAWLISLSTNLCGDTEFCIRLSTPILYFLSSIFVFLSTKLITDNIRLACLSSVIFNLMPGITFSSFFINTDVPLIFFSSVFSYIFLIIYVKEKPSYFFYIILGIVFGLGLLSKYAMSYLLIATFLTIIFSKNLRNKFLSFKTFWFFVFSLIVILPHLYWNFENKFVTLEHTASNANLQKVTFNLREPFQFFLSQFIIFGIYPLFLILFNILGIKNFKKIEIILLYFFLTPILLIALMSIFSRANANWAVVGFPFGFILLASLLNNKKKFSKLIYSIFSQIILSSFIILLVLIGKNNRNLDPFANSRHAKVLAESVLRQLNIYNNVAFMSDDREDFALMLYYARRFNGKRAKWNGDIKIDDHYELTTDVNTLVGYNLIFLTRTAPTEAMLNRCESSELLKSIEFSTRTKVKEYNIYLLENWK
ncbi:MAG: glycosyltransferase family 39 protein [Pseudomonadota bacterium]|nr:glycosyltransferase family 39 protein [Pseudomonadota bacterium]